MWHLRFAGPGRLGFAAGVVFLSFVAAAITRNASTSDMRAVREALRAEASLEAADRGAGRGDDRRTQSALRNAFVAEKTIFTDAARWADITSDFDGSGTPDLVEVEPSLTYQYGTMPNMTGVVFVATIGTTLYLSARSPAGSCYYLLDNASGPTHYATDTSCRDLSAQTWKTTPWAIR